MNDTPTTHLLDGLRAIVGVAHVLTHDDPRADLSAWEKDWRKRSTGLALAVVRPASTDQVAAVVALCAASQQATGTSIVPQGGNTGLVVGSTPDGSGRQVVLSLQRMNAVRDVDAANLTMTAEAGCVLQSLQDAAQQAGLLFPLSLAAEGSCTLGGNLGTNAGGTQVLRYGNTRDLCLGLEVVTAQGTVWHGLSGLRKDNTGYDLRNLLIGSEGTLGVITAACMKLAPLPAARLTAWAAVPSMEQAVELLGLAQRQLGAGLTGFEVMGQFALSLTAHHFPQPAVPLYQSTPWCVLLENSDSESEAHAREQFERLLEAALEKGCITDAVVAESLAQAQQLWQVRENIPLAQASEGLNIKHDVSIAVSRMAEFVRVTDALLQAALPGVRLVNFGHLGDGNLHYNVQAPENGDPKLFLQQHEEHINTLVFDSVARFGGSISAEHGVGSLKVKKLEHYKSPVALEMMRAVKKALDPQGLLNPGRVLRR
ncbi:MAG: FAD-binding oxidoreductase [Burkholderiaceae bacterium]